jgi:hypothetical protein
MGPGDFLPAELSEYFGISLYVIILFVFILGFITVRLTQKYGNLNHNLKSLDDIFLIVIIGLVWFFRLQWIYRISIPAFNNLEVYLSLWLLPAVTILSIFLVIYASVHDAEIIFNRAIRSRKPKRNIKHIIFKRGNPFITSDKIDKNIKEMNYYLVLINILFVIGLIWDKGVVTPEIVLYGLLIIFSFSPVIWVTISLYNYITSKNASLINSKKK